MITRFGFNGQQKTDEVYGKGNLNTALFWEYDTRIGRRWNVDPVDQISISNYAVNYLNPIILNDPAGDCVKCPNKTGESSYSQSDKNQSAELQDVVVRDTKPANPSTSSFIDLNPFAPSWNKNAVREISALKMKYRDDVNVSTTPDAINVDVHFPNTVRRDGQGNNVEVTGVNNSVSISYGSGGTFVNRNGTDEFRNGFFYDGDLYHDRNPITIGGAGSLSLLSPAGGLTNVVTRSPSVLAHIFRNAAGHVNPSTLAAQNRYIALFEKVANNAANINPNVLNSFQKTAAGFQGYSQTFRNGSQVWTQTLGGKIFNAGVNLIPK